MVNAITELARLTLDRIQPHCVSIEIAGAIRLGLDPVGGFEIVCAPRIDKLDEAEVIPLRNELRSMLDGEWTFDAGRPFNTAAHKRLFHRKSKVTLDLYTVPEGAWPGWLMFRTGPTTFYREFDKRLTDMRKSMTNGVIHDHPITKRHWQPIPCPYGIECSHAMPVKTEERLFGLVEWPYLKPEERGVWAAKRPYERV